MKTSLKLAAAALALGFTSVPAMTAGAFAETAVQEAGAGERGEHRRGRWMQRRHRGNPEAMAERLASMDANGDGTITRAEFQARHNAMFDRMDVNNDGVANAADRELLRSLWVEFAAERGVDVGEGHRAGGRRGGDREISRADFEARGNAMFDRMAGEGNDSVTIAALEERRAEMRERWQERRRERGNRD
ncbi:MAG: hypothetical protein ACQRW7_00765 [Caulobacterales bacterium]|uniref:hypothetical protein n=1 Tax=Glycocaulis sp. TaxID=1969725 RepID=UPI003FA07175